MIPFPTLLNAQDGESRRRDSRHCDPQPANAFYLKRYKGQT